MVPLDRVTGRGADGGVVGHAQLQLAAGPVQSDVYRGPRGVLGRVRQRLLDDAVGGQITARRQVTRLAGDGEPNIAARGAEPAEELVEAFEAWNRVPAIGPVGGVIFLT